MGAGRVARAATVAGATQIRGNKDFILPSCLAYVQHSDYKDDQERATRLRAERRRGTYLKGSDVEPHTIHNPSARKRRSAVNGGEDNGLLFEHAGYDSRFFVSYDLSERAANLPSNVAYTLVPDSSHQAVG